MNGCLLQHGSDLGYVFATSVVVAASAKFRATSFVKDVGIMDVVGVVIVATNAVRHA